MYTNLPFIFLPALRTNVLARPSTYSPIRSHVRLHQTPLFAINTLGKLQCLIAIPQVLSISVLLQMFVLLLVMAS